MKVAANEAVVENVQNKLPETVRLPEHAKVLVIVPAPDAAMPRIASPRLVHPEQAADFEFEVVEDPDDATV